MTGARRAAAALPGTLSLVLELAPFSQPAPPAAGQYRQPYTIPQLPPRQQVLSPEAHPHIISHHCLSLTFQCLSFTFHCLSLTFHCLSFTFHCLSFTFHCLSLTFHCLSSAFP